MKFFLSRRWKPNKWPFYVLIGFEFPLTVALLALFGIASPNTYRTKLWQDGADNGFNSSPLTGLYAAANYRPYTTPKVWSQFITNYNVVIAVLSMFIMLVKSIMYMLHVFPPILSILVHALLIALYTVSVDYQASSDTTDPDHPQNGPPWYITKSCSVTRNKSLVGYCKQGKASFACTCAMLGVFVIYFGFAAWSCFPSRQQREEYAEQKRLKAEKWARFETLEDPNTGETMAYPMPETPGAQGGLNPLTPRTMAFNRLGGTKDLPLRNHFSTPNAPTSPPFAIRSPDLPRSPMSPGFVDRVGSDVQAGKSPEIGTSRSPNSAAPQLYFPPPPKTSKK
ncbi:hypothetical protein PV05_10037 [Exophiala xenobiotica]|uniref:Uncharacterized protein n=1 Tax=Exophiala xenobiotica TaxID=348802 RepID=A0A0D2E9F5_9EURO|nr:uncharacterized protein PV05_10037 [Exophiala xenobiotica]KIW51300.1 hypothetical protein PV05_10037 [Exophiala xenobiotica]